MKPLRKHLKLIALFLAVTFLVQSCRVYTYNLVTVDEAVNFNLEKLKTKSSNDESFRFDKLEKKEGVYYGIASKNSKTAKKLADQITYEDKYNNVKIFLKEEQLREIYIKEHDRKLYTILAIGISVLMVGGIVWVQSNGGFPSY